MELFSDRSRWRRNVAVLLMRYAAIYVLAVSGGNYAVRWALSRVPDAARVNGGLAAGSATSSG